MQDWFFEHASIDETIEDGVRKPQDAKRKYLLIALAKSHLGLDESWQYRYQDFEDRCIDLRCFSIVSSYFSKGDSLAQLIKG